jgi:tetratricopeptide (TPR) repeat protein
MAPNSKNATNALEIDRLALQLAKDPHSKAFLPLAEEYCKAGMWAEAAVVLEDGLKCYPGFITAMVVLGRAYDQLNQPTKAKAILEEAVKLSPDNLRAHRTLIKIYTAQGLADAALKSCDVILSFHHRDEEALSVQAKLGRPAKQEPDAQKKSAPVKAKANVPILEPEPPKASPPAEFQAEEVVAAAAPAPVVEEVGASMSPLAMATTIMESALHASDRKSHEQETSDELKTDSPAVSAPLSSRAETIEQLEAWLRSIKRERRDHSISGEPNS